MISLKVEYYANYPWLFGQKKRPFRKDKVNGKGK